MTRTRALPGVTNVPEDLGFDDANELSTKALLAVKLNALIDERGLRQAEAARIMGLTQPRVSQLRHYRLRNISLERLLHALVALCQQVDIVVQPARRPQVPGVRVAA
jgi:predicted XRE-type DNA-binding protein